MVRNKRNGPASVKTTAHPLTKFGSYLRRLRPVKPSAPIQISNRGKPAGSGTGVVGGVPDDVRISNDAELVVVHVVKPMLIVRASAKTLMSEASKPETSVVKLAMPVISANGLKSRSESVKAKASFPHVIPVGPTELN